MFEKGASPNSIKEVISCEFHHPLIWSGPSISRSHFHNLSKSFLFLGYPNEAHGASPESNHTSRTSFILSIWNPHLHFSFTSSIYGLWRSFRSFPSSLVSPMTLTASHLLHVHMGRGIPQYLCLDIGQSPRLSSQFPKRCFAHDGCQFTLLFSSISFFLISVTLKNHCWTANCKRGEL